MTLNTIDARLDRILQKLEQLQNEVKTIQSERTDMGNKIEDAQARIQKILNRLPKQEDNRQMKLLDGEIADKSVSPLNGDSHE
jgi:chromosome segregation ATPase